MTRDEILMAVARGWTTPENSHKEMDHALVSAIVSELMQAQTNAQQTHGEICPHYYETEGRHDIVYQHCRCSGKLSPC